MTILTDVWAVARKNYYCDGFYWLEEFAMELHKTEGVPLLRCEHIRKGEKYHKTVHTDDGFQVFRCCKSCDDFAKKHSLQFNDSERW